MIFTGWWQIVHRRSLIIDCATPSGGSHLSIAGVARQAALPLVSLVFPELARPPLNRLGAVPTGRDLQAGFTRSRRHCYRLPGRAGLAQHSGQESVPSGSVIAAGMKVVPHMAGYRPVL